MDLENLLKDFVDKVLAFGEPIAIYLHSSDLQSIGRSALETVFNQHKDLIPPHMETIFNSNEVMFFGKRVVENFFKNKIGVEPSYKFLFKGRAEAWYKNGSTREIKLG